MVIRHKRISWKVRRNRRLRADGFLAWELKRFTGVHKLRGLCDFPMSRPYINRMRVARREFFINAIRNHLSKADYRKAVDNLYITMGWFYIETRAGREAKIPDVWAMLRYYYRKSIQQGDYEPPPKKKKKWSKGDIVAQKQRRKDKAAFMRGVKDKARMVGAAYRGDPRAWIAQLEAGLKTETNPARRAQFEAQIKRLRAML